MSAEQSPQTLVRVLRPLVTLVSLGGIALFYFEGQLQQYVLVAAVGLAVFEFITLGRHFEQASQ